MIRLSLVILILTIGMTQTIDSAVEQLQRGEMSDVLAEMESLRRNFGQDPALQYLEASIETNGGVSAEMYRQFIEDNPDHRYAPSAMLKVAEYYYVSGLYVRAGEWLKKYLKHADGASDLDRGLQLLEKSLTISGNADSAVYYLGLYGKTPSGITQQSVADIAPEPVQEIIPIALEGNYGVQVGIFGSIENAAKHLKELEDHGYTGQIKITIRNGNAMHAVVIGNYGTDLEARKISNRIKSSLGIDAFVVKH